MKILLTGGGTGGHFYPLIAIAESLNELALKEKIINMKLYYMSDSPYDKRMLFENGITFIQIPAGKMRTYFSVRNFFDMFSTTSGAFFGLLSMFFIYPDVVISKGGYAAFPAVFAAKLLRIPVIIHESDSSPGRLNLWTAKWASRIACSWSEAVAYFPQGVTILTGQPIRKDVLHSEPTGAHEYFKLSASLPTIFVVGGSSGADMINNTLIQVLPELLKRYQVVHQTGVKLFDDVVARSNLILDKSEYKDRYVPVAYLNNLSTRMAAGAATIVISRAGSAIFEIASWGVPSIIIPITNSNGDHQRKNAYSYAREGGCEVIEEANLTSHVLVAEIDKLMGNSARLAQMKERALLFANPGASSVIAQAALDIGVAHES
jgi:UDP-N-acetylglucosamine--N-acetylmuramyl-(pentapeptide) pyrophosphoryl-undecaprenol N-acetylglucosamine transferase